MTLVSVKPIYELVHTELKQVDALMSKTLIDGSSKVAKPFLDHLLHSPGKKLRAVLSILCFYASTDTLKLGQDRIIELATAIELIHLASLVHDDVIDNATTRRNQDSLNAKWGNETAVAMGVYLYAESLKLIANIGRTDILKSLSGAVKAMCEGELFQLADRGKLEISKDRYLTIIKDKTADLFSATCLSASMLATSDSSIHKAMGSYGHYTGLIFQMTDDYLDLFGQGKHLQKNHLQDIDQGQITLPIINLYHALSIADKAQLEHMLRHKLDIDLLMAWMQQHQIQEKTASYIVEHQTQATEQLNKLANSSYKEALLSLVSFITKRIKLS